MKNFFVILLIIPILLFCGFKKKHKAIIILSSNPISKNNAQVIENNFNAHSRIFYTLYAPDGFKNSGIRFQLSKQDDKTSNWGFSIITSRDIYVDTSEKVYNNYLYIQQNGHYIIQFFYLDNKDYPFAHREFRVQ